MTAKTTKYLFCLFLEFEMFFSEKPSLELKIKHFQSFSPVYYFLWFLSPLGIQNPFSTFPIPHTHQPFDANLPASRNLGPQQRVGESRLLSRVTHISSHRRRKPAHKHTWRAACLDESPEQKRRLWENPPHSIFFVRAFSPIGTPAALGRNRQCIRAVL